MICTRCRRDDDQLRRGLCHACYERDRRAGKVDSLVDPTVALEHLQQLRSAGLGTRAVAEMAGLNRSTVYWLARNPHRRINARTAAAILAIPVPSERVHLEWAGSSRTSRLAGERPPAMRLRTVIGGQVREIACGDCDHYPCRCEDADDWDVALLGSVVA